MDKQKIEFMFWTKTHKILINYVSSKETGISFLKCSKNI